MFVDHCLCLSTHGHSGINRPILSVELAIDGWEFQNKIVVFIKPDSHMRKRAGDRPPLPSGTLLAAGMRRSQLHARPMGRIPAQRPTA
jgi:hypothetical protein